MRFSKSTSRGFTNSRVRMRIDETWQDYFPRAVNVSVTLAAILRFSHGSRSASLVEPTQTIFATHAQHRAVFE
jgi:hypothetical protein